MARSKKRDAGAGWVVTKECPTCRRPESECVCSLAGEAATRGEAIARMRLEKRRGKPVTVVELSGVHQDTAKGWSKELKSKCASGGSYKGGELELQGDHRERAREFFRALGLRVKG